MNILNYKNIIAVAFLLVAVTLAMLVLQQPRDAFGSTFPGGEYNATTTTGMGLVHNRIAANRPVALGSIVVASSSATTVGAFKVWNATSTTDVASTTLFGLKAGVAEGTYTFDTELTRGLIVEKPAGFNGEYVITYRAQ